MMDCLRVFDAERCLIITEDSNPLVIASGLQDTNSKSFSSACHVTQKSNSAKRCTSLQNKSITRNSGHGTGVWAISATRIYISCHTAIQQQVCPSYHWYPRYVEAVKRDAKQGNHFRSRAASLEPRGYSNPFTLTYVDLSFQHQTVRPNTS